MSAPGAYVGTYTDGASEGIYRWETGDSSEVGVRVAAATENPSYLAVHPAGDVLYAVNELSEGALTAFRIEPDGSLARLDHRAIGPADPCHCSVDPAGRYLFVAHYTGGAISLHEIADDGTLGDSTIIAHEGSSVDPDRQTAPHPHTIRPGPEGEFVYVADLGTDEIVRYALEVDAGRLRREGVTPLHDGAGPRQFDFGPAGRRLYCINELDSTLSVFERATSGDLGHRETVSTLPPGVACENQPGAVAVHPDGQYVYGSNRGHDSLSIFAITETGLDRVDSVPTRGKWPRDFAIGPRGERLFVANADSNSIVPFAIDGQTGRCEPLGTEISVPDPVCVRPHET